MSNGAICRTCPWWVEIDNSVDPWNGKPWEGKRPRPHGDCRRMPETIGTREDHWCAEHPDRAACGHIGPVDQATGNRTRCVLSAVHGGKHDDGAMLWGAP